MACDQPRRDVQRTAEGRAEVGEIAANTSALREDITRGGGGCRGANLVVQFKVS
jgi:hypothetical protein